MILECNRCQVEKEDNYYISDSKFPGTCKQCFTNDELHDYIVPDISKAMKGLKPKQKQKIIQDLVKDYRRKKYETVALQRWFPESRGWR